MSETFIGRVGAISKGVSYPATKSTEIGDLFICFPSQKEQVAIATYLDKKTAKIDSITTKIQEQIKNLKELRKTLINDVVTGKIKVTSEDVAA